MPNEIPQPEKICIVHEIKVQVADVLIDGKWEQTILIRNDQKVPYDVVNDMLSCAIVANLEMQKHFIKQS